MPNKPGRFGLIAVTAVCCAVLLCVAAWLLYGFGMRHKLQQRTIELNEETVTVELSVSSSVLQRLDLARREYSRPESQITMGRLTAKLACAQRQVECYDLQCSEGTVYWYDAEHDAWSAQPLQTQTVASRCIFIETDAEDYFIYTPLGYTELENNALRPTGSQGYLVIEEKSNGWQLRLFSSQLKAGDVSDYTVVCSNRGELLLDSGNEAVMNLWKTYAHYNDGRWCFDGYYFPAADSYVPTDCLFRCVAAYGVRSMVHQASGTPCANDLAVAMLDTMALQQTEEGFFPTTSESMWLSCDYGIGSGFYDTRFNSDLMMIYYKWIVQNGGYEQTVNRYLDFYLTHAECCHTETENGGWLVWDYATPEGREVHSSLNHQLAEMQVLYQYADLLDRPELAQLADRMLAAIEDTEQQWIMEDGNLHYAHLVDGSFGMSDYPYLTYNDLYDMQKTLSNRTGSRNAALERLMASKLAWMQASGVTGYYK